MGSTGCSDGTTGWAGHAQRSSTWPAAPSSSAWAPAASRSAVCPPSAGADGRPRRWNGVWEIALCPEGLIEVVTRMADAQVPGVRAVRGPRAQPRGTPGRYALAVLEREADRVRTAGPGTRNSTLNRAAFRLGQLVAAQALDRVAVEVALTGAALAAGLGPHEVERTINSGLEAGLAHPRGSGTGR